jgi:hypothetical protein
MVKRSKPTKAKVTHTTKSAPPLAPAQELLENREEWLDRACQLLLPFVRQAAAWLGIASPLTLPPRVACSWLPGRATAALSASLPNPRTRQLEIVLSPSLGQGRPDADIEVLGWLLHELTHAVVGAEHGHLGPFARVSAQLGMAAPYSQGGVGEDLAYQLRQQVLRRIGRYPHSALPLPKRLSSGQNRQRKWVCDTCGKIVRCAGELQALHLCGGEQQGRFVLAEKA